MSFGTQGGDIEMLSDYPMRKYLYIKVGGEAERLAYPRTMKSFLALLSRLHAEGEKVTVLGAGSNTIITERGMDGVVVSTRRLKAVRFDGNTVEAECGAMLSSIMNNSIKRGLTGFEFAAGIPGTVGGSVYMNAGANGGEIKDAVKEVYVWREGRERRLERKEINFEYRRSNLPPGAIVTRAVFKLSRGDRQKSERNVREYLAYRNRTQPVRMANTGSVFKNPPEMSAGRLLENLGFKGLRVGGAKFSELHANFIVNFNRARADDIIELIDRAKKTALEKSSVALEAEVEIMGREDEGR